jgi:hypothetical protein
LQLVGVTSYFNVQKPTPSEISDDVTYRHVYVTGGTFWDPSDTIFSENELNIRYTIPQVIYSGQDRYVLNVMVSGTTSTPNELYEKILSRVEINSTGTHRKGTISASELAKRWYVGVETARRTLHRTTQLGVRDFANIKGTRRMKYTAHQLMFRHLRADVYTGTMFIKVKTLRQNT